MSEQAKQPQRTEHALLVLWGEYARQLDLIQGLMAVPMHQKVYTHHPQSKVIEFLVAILAGLPHLADLSQAGHPLDQDGAVALAWQQPGWADYSGVSRTLQALTWGEAQAVGQVLDAISQPFIDREVVEALRTTGFLLYDGDLTGRPVSKTSTTDPGAAYGYMDDTVQLGYQAAVISLRSPSYGRLWLSVKPHPGNTLSCTQVEAMVMAAEAHTGVRPRRRTELVRQRLAALTHQRLQAQVRLQQRQQRLRAAEVRWQVYLDQLARTQQRGDAQRSVQLRIKVETQQVVMTQAQRRVERQQEIVVNLQTAEATLLTRLQHLEQENGTNGTTVRIIFRLDAGFATWENLIFLIEMGYELYTKPYNNKVVAALRAKVDANAPWTRVGDNAEMVAWPQLQFKGCPYALAVGLERFYTGKTLRYSTLVYFGSDPVTQDLPAWFATYNARQLIEAGIKEGKGVFQLHHLKVRSAPALWLQEQFAAFAANFVRWAAVWLDSHCRQLPAGWADPLTVSIKRQVRVAAHTPAFVQWLADGCLVRFTDESPFAGHSIVTVHSAFQLCLPIFKACDFTSFSTI